MADWRLDPHEDEDGFRHSAVAYFRDHDAVYEIKAQLWADAEKQPIEVDWPVSISPCRTVATLRLPRQEAYGAARVRVFDDEPRMIRRTLTVAAVAGTAAAVAPMGAAAQTVAFAADLHHFDVTIRRFDPAGPPGNGQLFVLPVNSRDAEHAIASTIANASAFSAKTDGSGQPASVAFMAVRVQRH